jgi:hypothetical protein
MIASSPHLKPDQRERKSALTPEYSAELVVENANGIHCAPSDAITKLARKFEEVKHVQILVKSKGDTFNADSPWIDICQEFRDSKDGKITTHYTLMGLCACNGDKITLGINHVPSEEEAQRIFKSFQSLLKNSPHLEFAGKLRNFFECFAPELLQYDY